MLETDFALVHALEQVAVDVCEILNEPVPTSANMSGSNVQSQQDSPDSGHDVPAGQHGPHLA